MKTKEIGIWGQFGDGGQIADGQAVRTTIITEEIKRRYGSDNVMIVNTNNWKRHPISFLFKTIKLNALCKKLVIFPADNGFKVVVPIFDFTNRIFKSELFNVVIGGYLPGLLKKKPAYIGMIQKYQALFVQTQRLSKDLESFSLNNIYILSNLKRLNTVQINELKVNDTPEVKLCIVSRITNDKGISYAVEAVKLANEALGKEYISLDIFGIVSDDYKDEFEKILAENCSFVSYCGVLDYDKTTEALKGYFLMLMPTFYYGEGFPGCVIDAYNAALPVIATDWNYNKDVIKDNENGLLVPIKNPQKMSEAILKLYADRELAYKLANNNVTVAEKYRPDRVLETFYSFLDKKNDSNQ